MLVAVGLRHVQELGAHMRSRQGKTILTIESELIKRVFWMLLISDAFVSAVLGRPRVMTDDECVGR